MQEKDRNLIIDMADDKIRAANFMVKRSFSQRRLSCDRARFFQVVLASTIVLLITFSPAGAQTEVTPSPTATDTGDESYPPPVPTEPYYTETPNAYPGQEASQTPLVPPTIGPSPTVGAAVTVTPGIPTPRLPIFTPVLTLSAPGITTTDSFTSTATLIPLPALTLVFPKQNTSALLVTATPDAAPPSPPWTQPQRLVPLALIGFIWVILASWFYYSQKEF